MRPQEPDPIEPSSPSVPDAGAGFSDRSSRGVQRRPLGALGENVSALGLGCGALARLGDHADWDATLGQAMELGIDVLDAAPRELRPFSEEMLGRVMGARRDSVFLSTRCTPLDGKPFDTSEAAVRAQVEASLRRLRTDRIDLYQVHDVETANPKRLLETTLPALVAARERGEVRYIGASGGSLELLRELLITFPVDAILSYARLDLSNADLAEAVLPLAHERGAAVLNASPLHMGLLADPVHAREIADADRPVGDAAQRAFEIASRASTSLPRLALQFAAADERVACTLVGCANVDEVQSNAAAFTASATELEAKAIEEIRATFREATLH